MKFKLLICLLLITQLHAYEKHPVSTKNPEAQNYFDEGLTDIYAFNTDAAYSAFENAAKSDPNLAMAYWGMALSLGETINRKITPENQKKAEELIKKALELSPQATKNEQEYIQALSKRYTDMANLNVDQLRTNYKNAMKKLHQTYPDDPDAAVLYVDSYMNINPWRYWTPKGKPEPGTLEMIETLESVMKSNPMHLGANHLYIHAVEESKNPEKALIQAHRLKTLLPSAGHILHMPSHIYILVGDYEEAVQANLDAIAADQKYIKKHGLGGFYPVHYLSHNYFFLVRSYMWQERYEQALQAAKELENFYLPHWEKMPLLAYYALGPMQVLLYFHRNEEILQLKEPDPKMKSIHAFWHFARAMAYASLGDIKSAKQQQALFTKEKDELIAGGDEVGWEYLGYNTTGKVLDIADTLLKAKLAKGDQRVALLKKAVELQDNLNYNEPPDWYYPIRQSLGAAYLDAQENEQAEQVFRQALDILPRNGRSLFGLLESLKAQNQQTNAYWVEVEMEKALRYKKEPLKISDVNI